MEKKNNAGSGSDSRITEQASQVKKESQKLGNEIYEAGSDKLNEFQNKMQDHSEKLVQTVQEKPLSSLLIAAGIGFLLSRLFK